jgi:hypothetical protein
MGQPDGSPDGGGGGEGASSRQFVSRELEKFFTRPRAQAAPGPAPAPAHAPGAVVVPPLGRLAPLQVYRPPHVHFPGAGLGGEVITSVQCDYAVFVVDVSRPMRERVETLVQRRQQPLQPQQQSRSSPKEFTVKLHTVLRDLMRVLAAAARAVTSTPVMTSADEFGRGLFDVLWFHGGGYVCACFVVIIVVVVVFVVVVAAAAAAAAAGAPVLACCCESR